MNKLPEELRKLGEKVQPRAEWLSLNRQHLDIQMRARQQTKYEPAFMKTTGGRSLLHWPVISSVAAATILIMFITPNSELKQFNQKVQGLFSPPRQPDVSNSGLKKLDSESLNLDDPVLPTKLNESDPAKNGDQKENRVFGSSSPKAVLSTSTRSTTTVPASAKRPSIIETLMNIIHLPSLPDKPTTTPNDKALEKANLPANAIEAQNKATDKKPER